MHRSSVFNNLCISVPVDPFSKMPTTAHERRNKTLVIEHSVDSSSTLCSLSVSDIDTEKVKNFYCSIPDYNEINHLSSTEFYSTLKSLREKKKAVLSLTVEHNKYDVKNHEGEDCILSKNDTNVNIRNLRKISNFSMNKHSNKKDPHGSIKYSVIDTHNLKLPREKVSKIDKIPSTNVLKQKLKTSSEKNEKTFNKTKCSNKNHSACLISWHDVDHNKNDVDVKFENFFGKKYKTGSLACDDELKSQSLPSSPSRLKRFATSSRRRKSITIPKPFKMTERDDDIRIVNELRTLKKSFSEDMLNQKREKKKFRARPVPIESRIPLYDKILEDQSMRRAINKINSEAELKAQMKPFSFTDREENSEGGVCRKAVHALPKAKKKKCFRARPVPKNLFSNYFYDRIKQNEFFRSMNRRIRAEEMLRNASYPGKIGSRERSHLSTPAAHSDLPIDPSPARLSTKSSDRLRSASPIKMSKVSKDEFITTSPQPFRFKTASRAEQKMQDIAKELFQSTKNSESISDCIEGKPRAYSALELKSTAAGRSNLAALLRAETVRRRFESEAARSQAEQRRQHEMRQRGRLLRSKPAWHLVKNNHEEDIAMRLQTRRDEERMRHEEFLHEMEMMYERVQQQPMLFERFYAPRSGSVLDCMQLSPRRSLRKKRSSGKSHSYPRITLCNSFDSDLIKYLNKIDNRDQLFENSEILDSTDKEKL